MQPDGIALHLIDLTLPFSGVAYLLLGVAALVLAMRFGAWSAAVSCTGFVYIAVVKFLGFGWSLWDTVSPVAPHWLDMLARLQTIALLVSAVALVVLVAGRKSGRNRGRTP